MAKTAHGFKIGDRVQSTETGAYGTYLGNGRTRFDACFQNGRHWKEKSQYWSEKKLKRADENDPNPSES